MTNQDILSHLNKSLSAIDDVKSLLTNDDFTEMMKTHNVCMVFIFYGHQLKTAHQHSAVIAQSWNFTANLSYYLYNPRFYILVLSIT